MKKILIYNGEGANAFGIHSLVSALKEEQLPHEIAFIKSNHFLKPDWADNCALLIFPGGRDIPYHRHLQGPANQSIIDYVHAGGSFLGICAGGYYGCAEIEFEKDQPLEVITKRELRFFPGKAQGPIYGLGKFCYRSAKGAKIAQLNISSTGEESAAFFNGGCGFVDAEKYANISVEARYGDIQGQPAAIVHCSVGNGKAILCGIHPEYSAFFPGAKEYFSPEHLNALEKIEDQRRQLFRNITNSSLNG